MAPSNPEFYATSQSGQFVPHLDANAVPDQTSATGNGDGHSSGFEDVGAMAGLLDGLVVVELADPLTEYGGSLLAGLGAEVILVEPPGGAATRFRRPFAPGATSSRQSIPFLARNAGKQSVVLDPESPADIAKLTGMLERADGILEGHYSPFRTIAARLAPGQPSE